MSSLFESDYLYGFHDPGGEKYMLEAGKPGWIVFTEGLGRDPNNRSGFDYRPYSSRGLGVIARLNHGYFPEGTIPNSAYYADFAKRCANFVASSPGCKIWIIGNEMNYRIERPGAVSAAQVGAAAAPATGTTSGWGQVVQRIGRLFNSESAAATGAPVTGAAATGSQPESGRLTITPPTDDPYLHGLPQRFSAIKDETLSRSAAAAATVTAAAGEEIITPELYARCYRLCRDAIRAVPGHADDQVLVGAVAPWNNQTTYAGNSLGDWVQYFQDILNLLGPTGCDGITLHTYTHQADPNLITSTTKMNPPFQNRHFEFRTYMDFMGAIPATMRSLPVYITETDQDVPWVDSNTGWVQRAYGEINWWNQQPGNQKIRALILYRYPPIDRWVIQGKMGVIQDFQRAMQNDYRWRQSSSTSPTFAPGASVATNDVVNLRRTAGYVGKPSTDILWQAPRDTTLTLVSGPQTVDGLVWWQVRTVGGARPDLIGWVARTSPAGVELLRLLSTGTTPGDGTTGDFAVGDTLQTVDVTRVRRTAGYTNKPATDVVTDLPAGTRVTVLGGPSRVDNLTWWQIRSTTGQEGWAAQVAPNGQVLLQKATAPAPITGTFAVGDRIVTRSVVRMRQSPGYLNKPATDVVADIPAGTQGTVLAGPQNANNLTWWRAQTTNAAGAQVTGWMAEKGPDGQTLLEKAASTAPTPTPVSMGVGDLVAAASPVRVRRSPGYSGKSADDVLGELAQKATVYLTGGPRSADSLQWWQVGGIGSSGQALTGWSADRAPNGAVLIAAPNVLPGTTIPNKATGTYLGAPFQGNFGISQLWGENPQIYGQITYDGVRLLGHNGIDFLTPTGTSILAVDSGVVQETVYNDPSGFGHFVKVRHNWGEALYAHLNTIDVQVGRQVARGDALGTTGNTGFSNGPHLHFAIRINPYSRTDGWGGFSDPLPYLLPSVIQMPSYVVSTASRQAATALPGYRPLAEAPGYAPDKPGVVRP